MMEVISRALKLTMRSLVAARRCEAESMLDFNGGDCRGCRIADARFDRMVLSSGSLPEFYPRRFRGTNVPRFPASQWTIRFANFHNLRIITRLKRKRASGMD